MAQTDERVMPTGECFCGCGETTSVGAYFVMGHDKVGESAVIKTVYGDVPHFMVHHGFGPGGKNAKDELDRYRKNGGKYL